MITAAAFTLAAAGGALVRAVVGRRLNRPGGFPAGTLSVNVSGSLLLGLLSGSAPPLVTVLGTAGLGAYTTFSSFARDAVALVEEGRAGMAALYVALTCASCVAAAWAGVVLAG